MNLVGKKIRQLRVQQGISQEYMAEELGITQPSYARLENEDSRINVVRLQLIAKTLEVQTSELLGEKAQNIIHTNNGNNAQAYINSYSSNNEYIQALKDEISFLRDLLKSYTNKEA